MIQHENPHAVAEEFMAKHPAEPPTDEEIAALIWDYVCDEMDRFGRLGEYLAWIEKDEVMDDAAQYRRHFGGDA